MGVVLAVGLGATASSRAARAIAGALPVVLVPTLYFTFGRAAWLALAVGLAAALVLPSRRRPALTSAILLAAPWTLFAVILAARSPALTTAGAPTQQVAEQGHRLALALAPLAVGAGLATFMQGRLEAMLGGLARLRIRRSVAVGALVIPLAAGVVAGGGPARLLDRVERSFSTPPAPLERELDQRLFSFYGQGRAAVWRVAWDAASSHPIVGIGAGSFEQRWLANRPTAQGFRDAHNRYLETLAELGVIGLALLVVAFGAPALAGVRAGEQSLVPAATGALAVYLVHTASDWDWEMPAVTVAALACGVATLGLARPERALQLGLATRAAGVATAAVLAGFAVVGVVKNGAVGASIAALRAGDYAAAEREAATATRWAPWSSEARRWMGEAQLARGDLRGARYSFTAALSREPRNWALWYGLALASDGRARQRALARAAALNPLSPEVRAIMTR